MNSLREVAFAASKAGMTYGQFVAFGGKVDTSTFKPKKRRYVIRNPEQYEKKRKKVVRIDADGNRVVFDSVMEAAEHAGIGSPTMSRRVKLGIVTDGVRYERLEATWDEKANV